MVAVRVAWAVAASFLLQLNVAAGSISSSMIVEMREITSVSLSPDGTRVVVGVCHANPRTNRRELSWVIVALRGGAKSMVLPAGDEIYDPAAPGALLNVQAQWSQDGKWFFYLRREGREVQLWETDRNGKMTGQVTWSKSDLIGLTASSDPNELIVRLAPDRELLRKAEEEEDRNGILYDEHVIGGFPLTETLPIIDRWRNVRLSDSGEWLVPGWSGTSNAVFDIRRHTLRMQANVPNVPPTLASETASNRVTVIPLGQIPANGPHYYGGQYTLQLESKTAAGSTVRCAISECIANGITVLGWSPDGTEIFYLADSLQGRLGSRMPGLAAIYAWNPNRNLVRLIHDSHGRLYNLDAASGLRLVSGPMVGPEIVVAFSGADQPPELVAIDLASGVLRVLFDPNAELRALTRGRAAWHTWTNSSAYPGRGIIILPDDYQPGLRYPAVITSYTCGDGFLRGGGADDAPEFVAAHQGFIAICVDVTVPDILVRESDPSRIYAIMCDIFSGLIEDLTKSGMIDPTRVGLSGHSLGANAGAYCISHSSAFAAAALRHGSVIERAMWDLFEASSRSQRPKDTYKAFGMPDPRKDPTGKWEEMSVANKAARINTPTLIQADDTEYIGALPLWNAMREVGKPVEMYVFPKETHVLIQPIHRLVNYERQLDWFRFWLKQEEDPAPSKRDQYLRWNRLRESLRNMRAPH